MKLSRLAASVAAVALFTAPAQAQVDIISTTGVNGWQVSCMLIGTGPGNPVCNNTFQTAQLVSPTPGDWPAGPWIAPVTSGILGRDGNGEAPRWKMTFRKNIMFSDVILGQEFAKVTVSRMLLDNYFLTASFNGVSFVPNWSGPAGAPLPAEGKNWNKVFQFTNNSVGALQEGSNTLEFTITGNGQTDAIAIEGNLARISRAEVPEPATAALLLVGLFGLGARARRRLA